MNNTKALRILAGVIITSCASVTFAYAETSASAGGKLEVAPIMMKIDADGKVEMEMESHGGMMKPLETKGEVRATLSATSGMHRMDDDMKMEGGEMEMEKEHGIENAMMHADEHAMDALEKVELHVNVHTLMESEGKEDHKNEIEILSATEVHSSADFEHLIAHKAKSDEHLKGVEVKDGKVEITYAMPVKFLGFWGTTLDTTLSGDASGNVTFDYPWYAVFMKKDFSKKEVEPVMKAELEATVSTDAGGGTGGAMKRTYAVPHVFEAMISAAAKVKASWNLKENVK